MRRTTPASAIAILGLLASSGCERQTTEEPAAPDDTDAIPAPPASTAEAPGASGAPGNADTVEVITTDLKAIPLPEGWRKMSGKTPKGTEVSIGIPSGWVEVPSRSPVTLFTWTAPEGDPAAGTKISAVALPFAGELDRLVEYNRERLDAFATLHADGVIKVGESTAYEVAASWTSETRENDSVQLLIATGKEGIGFLCVGGATMDHDELRPLCDKMFSTHEILGPTKAE